MPIKYSLIIPSYLRDYHNAAKQRIEKFNRAIESALNQTFKDFEIIVIADGCEETEKRTRDIIRSLKPLQYPIIRLLCMAKQPVFSGEPRNLGIREAMGDYIIYLDTDDYISPTHIESIDAELTDSDWVWFDDWIHTRGEWVRRKCDINKRFCHGTSNFCHKKSLGIQWGGGYDHDFNFASALKRASSNYKYINAGDYFVCHIPNRYDL